MEASSDAGYEVCCHRCGGALDALVAAWCSCLVTERSLVCPHCGACFCAAARQYKQRFWAGAPKPMWARKREEHAQDRGWPPNPEPGGVRRPLVLVVDDEPDICRIASRVVTGLGYGLVVGRHGEEGLELARRYRPDLVLTDALLPKLDGREMARLLKEHPGTAATKVAVMTSLYTSIKYRTQAFLHFKVDDYLSKPVSVEELRALLLKHLGPAAPDDARRPREEPT